jgi:hypothetical protein
MTSLHALIPSSPMRRSPTSSIRHVMPGIRVRF